MLKYKGIRKTKVKYTDLIMLLFNNIFDIPYIHPGIPSLNILGTLNKKENNNLKYIKIINYQEFLENNTLDKNYNYILDYGFNPTIEDYKIFLPHVL